VNAPQRNRPNQRRRPPDKRPATVDVWRNPGQLPEVAPITVPHEVGALLRSLGDPPMNASSVAGHYFSAVVERSAAIALALAASADLLREPDDR